MINSMAKSEQKTHRVNLHIYQSPFKFETRINKEIQTILDKNLADEIVICGTWEKGYPEVEYLNRRVKVIRIKTGFEKYKRNKITVLSSTILFSIKSLLKHRNSKITYINCHSLWVMPLCVVLKKITKAKLIYDAHELETERAALKGAKQKLAKILERRLIKQAHAIIVVGTFIAEWYRKEYSLKNVYLLRNIPLLTSRQSFHSDVFHKKFAIPDNHLIFIYQGVINSGRGIEIMLQAFMTVADNKHLVIMGYGPLETLVKEAAAKHANIHFQEAVPSSGLPQYTSGADVGVFVVENIGLSYYWCLPNKFFEYVYCGLPVIVSNFPEMSSIVTQFNCGWTIEPEHLLLADLINNLTIEDIRNKKKNFSTFYDAYNWESDSKILSEIYN